MNHFPSTAGIIITIIFIDYLAKCGITVPFHYNLKKDRGDPALTLKGFVEKQLELKILPRFFFSKAFRWEDTTQGEDFWTRHSTNWVLYLTRIRSNLEIYYE